MLARRVAAEALGTALLVTAVVGSGIMAEQLAGGNAGLALLCNTIPTGAFLAVLIVVLAPVSGAHFNPVVSAAMALRGDLPRGDLVSYIAAQCLGGIIGTVLAHLMFGLPALQISDHVRTGFPVWLGEAVATFCLLLVILGGSRRTPAAVPWLVGLTITAAYWFTSSTSFANPAVTIARSLTQTFAGIRPIDAPAFIVAEVVGALMASAAAVALFDESRSPSATNSPADAFRQVETR
jgi:glycerol uptake facilitator-like aquaporin